MYPWFWMWAPQLHFPWSGNVAQQIEPDTRWFFDSITPDAGNARVEKKAFEHASYGKQIGLITEVLIELGAQESGLSAKARKSLDRLKTIAKQIEQYKSDDAQWLADEIEVQLHALHARDAARFGELTGRLRPLLKAPDSDSA
jgi:hypothetical protein